MFSKFTHWLAGRPEQALSMQESRATFALFLIIAYCFNALPPNFFFNGIAEAGDAGSTPKQLFWVGVFLLSLTSRLNGARPANGMFNSAVPLLVLCLFLIFSSVWSLAPDITLRRAILQCIVIGSVLLTISSLQCVEQLFILIYRVASITLLFDMVMLLRSNGFDEAGLFRGIHPHKNVVGYIGALSIITGVWIRKTGRLKPWWNSVFLVAWLALLGFSQSKTSLALTVAAPTIAISLWQLSRWLKISLGVPLLVLAGLGYCIFAVAFIAGFDIARGIENVVHRIGFTGRDDIWQFLIARFLERPWLGYGYGGFWDIGSASPNVLYGTGFIPMINQAHNGYLDLLLNIGCVGFLAYLILLTTFFTNVAKSSRTNDSVLMLCWSFLVFSLLHNFTETSILRGYAFVWVVQLMVLAITYRLASESGKHN